MSDSSDDELSRVQSKLDKSKPPQENVPDTADPQEFFLHPSVTAGIGSRADPVELADDSSGDTMDTDDDSDSTPPPGSYEAMLQDDIWNKHSSALEVQMQQHPSNTPPSQYARLQLFRASHFCKLVIMQWCKSRTPRINYEDKESYKHVDQVVFDDMLFISMTCEGLSLQKFLETVWICQLAPIENFLKHEFAPTDLKPHWIEFYTTTKPKLFSSLHTAPTSAPAHNDSMQEGGDY